MLFHEVNHIEDSFTGHWGALSKCKSGTQDVYARSCTLLIRLGSRYHPKGGLKLYTKPHNQEGALGVENF